MVDQLKKSKKKIGLKECSRAIESGKVFKAYVAKDAEEKIVKGFIELCNSKAIELVYVDTMKNLGKACGIDVGASIVVELLDGM